MAGETSDLEGSAGLRRRHVPTPPPPAAERPSPQPLAPRAPPPPHHRKGFVELLLSPLSFVLGDGEPEDPQTAARTFTHRLRRRYGEDVTPGFEHTSFRDAVSTARTASKFLLVFLHSTVHDEAAVFCRYGQLSCEVTSTGGGEKRGVAGGVGGVWVWTDCLTECVGVLCCFCAVFVLWLDTPCARQRCART